jgi:hypothetical protein
MQAAGPLTDEDRLRALCFGAEQAARAGDAARQQARRRVRRRARLAPCLHFSRDSAAAPPRTPR